MDKCKVSECDSKATYRMQCVCQKHYFRFMRNGTYDLVRSRELRRSNPAGYQLLFLPDHPMAMKDGYVYEHRKVIWDKYGVALPDCEICGKETFWETCHIDHIDCDVKNNDASNLRPVCRGCNTFRHYPPAHTRKNTLALTFNGETKTANEWARDSRVRISRGAIAHRKARGMSDFDALFGQKVTHKSNG